MFVITRSGKKEAMQFDKITHRIEKLMYRLDANFVHPQEVTRKTIAGLYDGISTRELDNLSAEVAAYLSSTHPDYSILAARIAMSNLHDETSDDFVETMERLNAQKDAKSIIDPKLIKFAKEHKDRIDKEISYSRDFDYDYFGFKTLERAYLLREGKDRKGEIVERPQHMLMRVSLAIHMGDIERAIETYHLMSKREFTHATPTLFNAGTRKPQMSSCFLLTMKDDSIEGIYDTLKQTALISQGAGGIGLSIHNIRAKGSFIRGTNGVSNGIVPMLKVFNDTARYVDQGGGKRKGSFAVYLEPWHADIEDFLELRKNFGKEEMRARDLFYALWVNDLFMERVKADQEWSLFCPNVAKGLADVYGSEFNTLYKKYEAEGKAEKTVKARELWEQILDSQVETGMPFMVYKDAANAKSNQKNLGTIKSSNLCTEIIQYTSPDEVAVCNLASIALNKFVDLKKGKYNFKKLHALTKKVVYNLNNVIDFNYYPVPEAKNSNMKHRPVGLGVQGLADTFALLKLPFESEEAKELNQKIFETLYHAALEMSSEIAKEKGAYKSYKGSPMSEGKLQFDLWGVEPSDLWDWKELRAHIKEHGVRNSLLLAPMPTASTSQILGNNECFEPFTSNIYTRRVLSGEFAVVNKHLIRDLIELGLWNDAMKNEIIRHNGSVQSIASIPEDLKAIYKTVWEIKQKRVLELARDRGAFIDQSQSLNIHMMDVNIAKLSSMHFYAWESGLKTGMYYLRTKSAADAIKFTVKSEKTEAVACSLDNPEECLACGS